ncbi:MAG: hypothetical protein R2751_03175 [Bacteroidales bacterium]
MALRKYTKARKVRRTLPWVLVALFWTTSAGAQDKLTLDGYLSDMPALYRIPGSHLWENSLHNRLNLHAYPADWFQASLQVRTRLVTGNTPVKLPGYGEQLGRDPGWMDLSWATDANLGENAGLALSTVVDRLWMQFSLGDLEIKLGRQRINWGQTFVWNPNDIFNAYSYFEVDYPEKPGSDALRIQYYTGTASSLEFAAKIDSAGKATAAGYARFNAGGYDIQFLGGVYRGSDLVLGTGWSGNVGPAAFRGEWTYFRDLEEFADTTGHGMLSAGLDYTFPSGLWLQAEALYSGFAADQDFGSILGYYAGTMDVKMLGFTPWSFFSSVSHPLTPLLTGGFAAMWYPAWNGAFLGPNLALSLKDNLSLSLIFQYLTAEFDGPLTGPHRENNAFAFLQFKWNF